MPLDLSPRGPVGYARYPVKNTMVRVSDEDDRLISEHREGQADCQECKLYGFSGKKARHWYWETPEKETLCNVCPQCGLIRLFDAEILLGAELLTRLG